MIRLVQRRVRRPRCNLSRSRMQRSSLLAPAPLIHHAFSQGRRCFEVSAFMLPPVVFSGLVVTLFIYKSLMMVIFQNKIIYVRLPPNSRREKIADYASQCSGIVWKQENITSLDGTKISLCVASVNNHTEPSQPTSHIYILYFQGNASSLPPRLPFLSPVMRLLRDRPVSHPVKYTIVCCSYRGYWTSKGHPSEKGIFMDAHAALAWIIKHHDLQRNEVSDLEIPVVIWGQSIGAGGASNLAAQQDLFTTRLSLKSLILETPFISIRAMLETLYPQKWLPYRYLWPFLRNHLDTFTALGLMKERALRLGLEPSAVLLLEAGKDELVPKEHGDVLEKRCLDLGLRVRKKVVGSALHTEVLARHEGRLAVVGAIEEMTKRN